MSKVTITCKKCGHELPAGSVFCDNCGAQVTKSGKVKPKGPEKAKGKKSNIGFFVVVGIAFFIFALMISFIARSNDPTADLEKEPYESFDDRLANMTSRITPEQYEQIEFAMDYDEVVALLGEEGALNYGRHYAWPGEYFDMAEYTYKAPRVEVEFGHTMKVIGISEYNVVHGKEIYEATKTSEDFEADLHISDEQLKSLRGRMSYREIADIIGEEGVLTEARSERNGTESKTYEWRYMKDGESGYSSLLDITFYDDKALRSKYDTWGE